MRRIGSVLFVVVLSLGGLAARAGPITEPQTRIATQDRLYVGADGTIYAFVF